MQDHLPFQDVVTQVIEHDFVTITLYQARSLLLLEWKHQISFVERKIGFLQALDLTNQYQIKNWIASDQHLFFISPEEKNWLLTDWIVLVSQSPLLKLAVVYPEDYNYVIDTISFISQGQKQYQAKGKVELRTFNNFTSAFPWVLSRHDDYLLIKIL